MNAKTRAKRNFWIETAAVALVALVLIAAFIRSATKPIDAEDLSIQASDLRSLCAAGVELSNQFTAGNLTETFFTNQVELMHDKTSSIRETLDTSEFEPEIQSEIENARRGAAEIDIVLGNLAIDPNRAPQATGELRSAEGPMKQLEDKLKREVSEQ
jgi:hypothetical protein